MFYNKPYMGAYLGKGTYWQSLHHFDCRETTLSNAANSIFPCFGNLKLTCFIQKIVFQLYKTSKSAITFDRGACSTHCLQY